MISLRNATVLLALAGLFALPISWAQAQSATYQVRSGDTLSEIARKNRQDGVSRTEMMASIRSANPEVFPAGNINLLRVGQVLKIPGRAQLAAATPSAGGSAGSALYQEGLALEKRGDQQGAFKSFLAAGEAGHGLAQKKLGEIYDNKAGPVARDYKTSLQWYEKARAQGVPIPTPHVQMPR